AEFFGEWQPSGSLGERTAVDPVHSEPKILGGLGALGGPKTAVRSATPQIATPPKNADLPEHHDEASFV
ncbi:MAG TPA: hypothetical protein VGK73_15810, partial [Polyangiaceae bacterium]